jgi:flagellar hook-associated protein 2
MASAAVTFSGFNNVDFNLVLNSLMQVASQPLTSLQKQQSDLQSQITTYGTLTSRLLALQTASRDLGSASGLSAVSATSSNPSALGVAASGSITPGHYDVVVNELARAQVMVSASSSPDSDATVVSHGGSLQIGTATVTVAGDVTLQGLADAINATDGIGVQAAVVRTSPTSCRLALTSKLTGAAEAFTVQSSLADGPGGAFLFPDADDNGMAGDSAADNAISASDASLSINNIPVTSSSNTFTDVIPGLTLTAYAKDPGATIGIDVAADASAISSKLQKFVNAYNELAKFVGDQRTAAANGDSKSIGRNPLLRQISSSLRSALLAAHGTGEFSRLSQIGVTFTHSGTMELDEALLKSSLASNPDDVRSLIAGVDGAFTAVNGLVSTYAQANGLISTTKEHLTAQIRTMSDQITQLQGRLALQREALQKEFIEADMAMSRLKNQSSSLASFGSNLGSL